MPFITVPGRNDPGVGLHYDDVGAGKPVVLIHGWPLSSRSWEGQVPALAKTDFRVGLTKITVPTLVIHGDSDSIVPFEVSGKRLHEAISGSELVLIEDAPHGLTVSPKDEWNRCVPAFLAT